MNQKENSLIIKPAEAVIITFLLLGFISLCIIKWQLVPHIPIILSIFLLILYGVIKKVKWSELESGLITGAKAGLGAILIFFFIGMLISSWMASGTIPTFLYMSFDLVSVKWFYAIAFIITSIVGVSIGSSLTTAATVGSALIGIAGVMGISPEVTAGAVVSGAFFGDKMSPLSDTTILASSTLKVDLFEHIKNMAWTTVPAYLISLAAFFFLSPASAVNDTKEMMVMKQELVNMNLVHWYSLLPFIILALLAIKKVPSILTMGAGIISALVIGYILGNGRGVPLLEILFSGYKAETEIPQVDSLLSRGGMESMMFAVSLVLLALAMGGLFVRLGILSALLSGIANGIKKTSSLIGTAAATAAGINFLLGEQYLSIVLTGNAFTGYFRRAGLHQKNLSRVLEDAGTVVNPLVPWSVCGVFLTGVLGVSTVDYAGYAFFCLLCPLLTVLAGLTGFSITKAND